MPRRGSLGRIPSMPVKIRLVLTAYNRQAGVYQTIPGAAQSCIVNSPEELRRLMDRIWSTIEDGEWFDERNRPT